jgi:hypothetical protein
MYYCVQFEIQVVLSILIKYMMISYMVNVDDFSHYLTDEISSIATSTEEKSLTTIPLSDFCLVDNFEGEMTCT